MEEPSVYVSDSPIHGKGRFAKDHIYAGDLIGILKGVPTTVDG